MYRYTEKRAELHEGEIETRNVIKNINWRQLVGEVYSLDYDYGSDPADERAKQLLCEAIDRLSAYEDLGFTPDELRSILVKGEC